MESLQQDEQQGVRNVHMVRLVPNRWTPLPGTAMVVRWDGEREVTVQRNGEFWNLATLVVPGYVLAWVRLAERPELGAWPVVAAASRTTYRSRWRAEWREDGYASRDGQE